MTASPLDEVFVRLLAYGQAMLIAARNGDWDGLAELATKRALDLSLLDKIITPMKEGGALLPPSIKSRVSSLLTLENEIIPLLEQARNQVQEELQSIGSARRLANLYGKQENSGSGP